MQRTTTADRGQAKKSSQVFRDVATLLLLVLLAVSVRFDRPEDPAAVELLPSGVQAAEVDAAGAIPVMPAATPAVACPKARPAILHPVPAGGSPDSAGTEREFAKRFLIVRDGRIHEIHLSARFEVDGEPSPDCDGQRVSLVRS